MWLKSNDSCYVCQYLDNVDMQMYVKLLKYTMWFKIFLLLLSHMDEGTHTTPKDGLGHKVIIMHTKGSYN